MINLRVMPALQPHIPRRVATITAGHTSRPTTLPGPWNLPYSESIVNAFLQVEQGIRWADRPVFGCLDVR